MLLCEIFFKIILFFQIVFGSLVYNIPGVVTLMKFKRDMTDRKNWKLDCPPLKLEIRTLSLLFSRMPCGWKLGHLGCGWLSLFQLFTRNWVFLSAVINQTSTGSREIIEMKHKLWNVFPDIITALSLVVSLFGSAKEMSLQEDAWIGDVKVTCFCENFNLFTVHSGWN